MNFRVCLQLDIVSQKGFHGKTLFNENNGLYQILRGRRAVAEAWGRKSLKTAETAVSSPKNPDSWGKKIFTWPESRVKSATWKLRN